MVDEVGPRLSGDFPFSDRNLQNIEQNLIEQLYPAMLRTDDWESTSICCKILLQSVLLEMFLYRMINRVGQLGVPRNLHRKRLISFFQLARDIRVMSGHQSLHYG